MTDHEALDILRAQGHAVGVPGAERPGRVRVWVHGGGTSVEIETGRELWDVAEGKLTLEEVLERREFEARPPDPSK